MTPENDAQRPAQDPGQQPDENKSALAAINDSTVAKKANQALKSVTGTAEKSSVTPLLRTSSAPQSVSTTGWAISLVRRSPTSHFYR